MIKRALENIQIKKISSEFLKFAIVGILNTLINYGIFIFLLSILGVIYYVSGAIGFIAGAITGFILNRYWTFGSSVPIMIGSIKYFVVQLICLSIHMLIQISVTKYLQVPEVYSQLAGIAVTTIVNFVISRKFVFNK